MSDSPPPGPSGGTQPIGVLGALLAMFGWGASSILVKAIDLGGLVISSYRFAASTVLFCGYLLIRGRFLTLEKIRIGLPGGLGLAGDVLFFFSALKLTTVANATVVASLQPIVMIYLGGRFLGETISRRQIVWSVVAIVGVAVLLYGSAGVPESDWRGDVLAACALVGWTAYLYFAKATQNDLTPVEYTTIAGLVCAVLATPLAVVFGQELARPTATDTAYIAAMVFGSGILAHLLMNWSLHRIPVWVGSTMTLLIPSGSAAMAWLILGERLTAVQIIGMVITLMALGVIAIGTAADGRRRRAEAGGGPGRGGMQAENPDEAPSVAC